MAPTRFDNPRFTSLQQVRQFSGKECDKSCDQIGDLIIHAYEQVIPT